MGDDAPNDGVVLWGEACVDGQGSDPCMAGWAALAQDEGADDMDFTPIEYDAGPRPHIEEESELLVDDDLHSHGIPAAALDMSPLLNRNAAEHQSRVCVASCELLCALCESISLSSCVSDRLQK